MTNAIEVEQLVKSYGLLRALDGCSLRVPMGSVFGLLGPNGAGKTTLIRTLLGFISPTSGVAQVLGFDVVQQSRLVRMETAYLPAEAKLFQAMRGKEALRFFGSIHPKGDFNRSLIIADRLALDLSRQVGSMSTGMRQKLALAVVFGCNTRLLILDEPTANLDPTVRHEVMRLVLEAKSNERTVLFCSHVLQEVEEICDLAAIAKKGKIVHEVDIHHMKRAHRLTARIDCTPGAEEDTMASFTNQLPPNATISKRKGAEITMNLEGPLEHHWSWLSRANFSDVQMETCGLRDIYERFHGPETE